MSINIFLVILGTVALLITIGAFVEWWKHKEGRSARFFSLIEIILTTIMTLGSFAIGLNPEIAVKVIIPEMENIIDDNVEVQTQNDQLKAELKRQKKNTII